MQLLFPADPMNSNKVEPDYADEYAAALARGLRVSLFSFEEFENGRLRLRTALANDVEVLYRGWMLTPAAYGRLHAEVTAAGAPMHTSVEHYRHCHHLPQWYALCQEFTPETVVIATHSDYAAAVAGKDWSAFFIKDYVKSLTTQRGSVAATAADIANVVGLLEHYRGSIEGGICIREFEQFLSNSEERYFVWQGRVFARDGVVPEVVQRIAARIDSRFFSIDMVTAADGRLRLVELGDGQVSDRKSWSAEAFIDMLIG